MLAGTFHECTEGGAGLGGEVVESRLHLENVVFAPAEWIEDSALAGAPLASYAATQQETYRDPQTGPPVPSAMGQKRTFSFFSCFFVTRFASRNHASLKSLLESFANLIQPYGHPQMCCSASSTLCVFWLPASFTPASN